MECYTILLEKNKTYFQIHLLKVLLHIFEALETTDHSDVLPSFQHYLSHIEQMEG